MKRNLLLSLIVIGSGLLYYQCNNLSGNHNQANIQTDNKEYLSSVKKENGFYKIDTSLIVAKKNKFTLLAELDKENLAEITDVKQIPTFIKVFLLMKNFKCINDMANPGEEWNAGSITDFRDQVIKNIYDPVKKDSVPTVLWVGNSLPKNQMVYFGMGKNIALFTYFKGGYFKREYSTIIKFNGEEIIDFWYEDHPEDVITKEEIIKDIHIVKRRNNC
ncbi:MAG: hypothetical protein JNK50_08710 [Bacteroidia bacterium]|nr:hypothetical protein [Bacteroidia bacterium]